MGQANLTLIELAGTVGFQVDALKGRISSGALHCSALLAIDSDGAHCSACRGSGHRCAPFTAAPVTASLSPKHCGGVQSHIGFGSGPSRVSAAAASPGWGADGAAFRLAQTLAGADGVTPDNLRKLSRKWKFDIVMTKVEALAASRQRRCADVLKTGTVIT